MKTSKEILQNFVKPYRALSIRELITYNTDDENLMKVRLSVYSEEQELTFEEWEMTNYTQAIKEDMFDVLLKDMLRLACGWDKVNGQAIRGLDKRE